jgi:peroxin-19
MLIRPFKNRPKYPGYLKENSSKLKPEDKERFIKQAAKVNEIVAVYETPTYSDDNPDFSVKILHLMNEVCQSFLASLRCMRSKL